MVKSIKAYSGSHKDVIQRFEMKKKPNHPFCDREDILRELVRYALKMAFNDFNFRTLHKVDSKAFDNKYREWENKKREEQRRMSKEEKKEQDPPSVTMYLMERLGKPFEDRFVFYFIGDPLSKDDFDDWHHETCKMLLDNLDGNDGRKEHFRIYKDLKYGKAQKIVNMMFKHLYCFQSEEDWTSRWEPYFQYCHVTLDNFTLEWFERQVPPNLRVESWSKLEYLKDTKNKNGYLFYQTKIRDFFEAEEKKKESIYKQVTPFQAEFYIWPEIQLRLAAESFIFELNPEKYKGKETAPTSKRADIIKLPIDELIKKADHEIQEYEERRK